MRRAVIVTTLALVALALVLVFGALRSDCGIVRDWQQRGDAALLCVGVDPVRLWPWPPVAPYWEDPALWDGSEAMV